MRITTTCDLYFDFFPFDNQTCSIDFTSFIFNSNQQNFSPQIIADYSYDMGNTVYRINTLYAYIQLYNQLSQQYEMVSFVFLLKRNSAYYVAMFIIPIYFCNVFLIFGLFQPITIYDKKRSDKLLIGMTSLIVYVVIGMSMSLNVRFANKLPFIGKFHIRVWWLFHLILVFSHLPHPANRIRFFLSCIISDNTNVCYKTKLHVGWSPRSSRCTNSAWWIHAWKWEKDVSYHF